MNLHCDKMNCENNYSERCKAEGAYYIEGRLNCPKKFRPQEPATTTAELMAVSFNPNCKKVRGKWKSLGPGKRLK